ncbi:CaiB/BaiF CoA-transferase family protein [Thioalkalivibrio sp. XN279]|uniref:CaiB/BaiF CoA transferase family protein n=1 Tax=Thioalkalivibrio sp. XN279 TaxID=2714953 RepID=UPI00140C5A66|nr:CaiB/BaiF CoA-transferase family protein [Thioalkalivibrio sp. XN279]NHA15910.1 CoA transferase [Thioalkalivibrio sp. XN279]
MAGPLAGLKIIEVAGLGAGPYCGMMLADMGADVIRIERMPAPPAIPDPLARSRRSVALDLKQPAGLEALLQLVDGADALFEGFRPGVAERLGFGPEACLERNPRLVYGRMTGWGQDGPLAPRAGHDLNYIALSGALHSIGVKGGKPVPPLNLVGDFGGGGLLLAFGMVCALLERARSGRGQVVDAAMLDGAISMMAMFCGFRAMGLFDDATGSNLLGGAAHFYDTYETADGRFLAVAPIEPEFYAEFLERMGVDRERFLPHGFRLGRIDSSHWDTLKRELAEVFRTRTRDEWCALFADCDACVTPVLGLSEAPQHPHNAARRNFVEVGGVMQNAPAPRFSRSTPERPSPPRRPGADTRTVLAEAGLDAAALAALAEAGVIPPQED